MPETQTDPPAVYPPSATTPAPVASAAVQEADIQQRLSKRGRRMLANLGPLGWFSVDASIAFFSAMLGHIATPHYVTSEEALSPLTFGLLFAGLVAVTSHIAGLHDPRFRKAAMNVVGRVTTVVLASMLLVIMEMLFVQFELLGRYIVLATSISCITGMSLVRLLAWQYARSFGQTVCFLGGDEFCFRATRFTDEHPQQFKFRSLTFDQTQQHDQPLSLWAVDQDIDEIVFDASGYDAADDESLLRCLDEGIKVSSYTDFVEESYLLVPVENIDARWLFSARLDLAHPYYHGLKRGVDVVASVAGLILSSPLLLLAVILIRWESKGAAFYSQLRCGQFTRPFRIHKLRTMVQDAERDGAKWASQSDSRITRVGKILRKTRIDEIPQFWNVLKGDMSLVGPRPERPEFVEMLSREVPFYVQRHLVKPGLTGWAQINYPYGASIEDAHHKLTYDLYYVKRASLSLDLQILLRTIGAMMKGSR